MQGIREDLELFNVHFDRWFNESTLYNDRRSRMP
jgi:arginyl-tRNA synthetase